MDFMCRKTYLPDTGYHAFYSALESTNTGRERKLHNMDFIFWKRIYPIPSNPWRRNTVHVEKKEVIQLWILCFLCKKKNCRDFGLRPSWQPYIVLRSGPLHNRLCYFTASSRIIVPDRGDKVNSGIGLSYRLHKLAGRYDNPMPGVDYNPSQVL
jgi:hypothetical protein